MFPTHFSNATSSKEHLPLLDPALGKRSSWSLSAKSHTACILISIICSLCAFCYAVSIMLGHHKRGMPDFVAPAGCMAPGAIAGYRDIDALFAKHAAPQGLDEPLTKGYNKLYGSLFAAQRNSAQLVVEVEAGTTDLLTWSDYFTKAKVVGMGLKPEFAELLGEGDRVVSVTGINTTDPLASPKLQLNDRGIYERANILIDDGTHDPAMQGRTMENMYEIVDDDGLYVVQGMLRKAGEKHHFCGMPFGRPFVSGKLQNFTSPKLEDMLQKNGVFYTTMQSGLSESNAMVLMKNWSTFRQPFSNMPHNFHVVYNAMLASVPIKSLVAHRPLHGQQTGAACGSHDGIDVFIASAKGGVPKNVLDDFHFAKTGSFLFVEDASFSFCNALPSSGFWGERLQAILAANPDWFYAMTDEDTVAAAKILVVRKL